MHLPWPPQMAFCTTTAMNEGDPLYGILDYRAEKRETLPTLGHGKAELWFQPVATVCAATPSAALTSTAFKKCLIVLEAGASLTLECPVLLDGPRLSWVRHSRGRPRGGPSVPGSGIQSQAKFLPLAGFPTHVWSADVLCKRSPEAVGPRTMFPEPAQTTILYSLADRLQSDPPASDEASGYFSGHRHCQLSEQLTPIHSSPWLWVRPRLPDTE